MFDFINTPTTGQTQTGPNGVLYVYDGVKWTAQSQPQPYTPPIDVAGTHNVGRNMLLNGLFRIQQRGAGAWTTNSAYTADRWQIGLATTGGSCSVVIQAVSASTSASSFADESCEYILQYTNTAGTGASDYTLLIQNIEDVRRLSGKTVTMSFWAWANTGAPKVCVELVQIFGTGGSPSAAVTGIGSVPITLTTAPARYSVTIAIPSVAGKTFGTTAGTDCTQLSLWLSGGSSFASRSGNIGLQSNTFLFWGMQLEVGTIATPLEKLDPRLDLANCQRFFAALGSVNLSAAETQGYAGMASVTLPVTMRAQPTVNYTLGSVVNTNAANAGVSYTGGAMLFQLNAQQINAGTVQLYAGFNSITASADL